MLLVIGATSVGLVTCGLGLALLAAVTILATHPGEDPGLAWGSAFGFLIFGGCGCVFGAIAGFTVAIRWITQSSGELWGRITWIGIAVGLTFAIALRIFSDVLGDGTLNGVIEWVPATVLFITVFATLGGFFGNFVEGLGKRGKTKKKKSSRQDSRKPPSRG
jgi:hypothetical protein